MWFFQKKRSKMREIYDWKFERIQEILGKKIYKYNLRGADPGFQGFWKGGGGKYFRFQNHSILINQPHKQSPNQFYWTITANISVFKILVLGE